MALESASSSFLQHGAVLNLPSLLLEVWIIHEHARMLAYDGCASTNAALRKTELEKVAPGS
jgi:hypothetical protein